MAALSTYTRNEFLGWLAGDGTTTAPAALWVVLRSVSGGTTDASSRETITLTLDAGTNTLTSTNLVEFDNHSGGTVTMDRWAFYDNATANTGNEIALGSLQSSLSVANGDKVRIDIGSAQISEGTSYLSDTYAEHLLNWIIGTDLVGIITAQVEILDTGVSRGDQPLGGAVTSSILENAALIAYGSAPASGTIDSVRIHDGATTISQKTEAISYSNNDDLVSDPQSIRMTVI
jgi:hypothetical protein